jgi:hypothetical protein
MFIAFRFIAGASAFMVLAAVPVGSDSSYLALGRANVVAQIWMNEVVPVKMRAGLVDIHAVCLVFGYTVSGWVGFGFFFWNDGMSFSSQTQNASISDTNR